jgi:hypothetical protein
MSTLFWVVTLCWLADTNVSKEHTVSIIRVEMTPGDSLRLCAYCNPGSKDATTGNLYLNPESISVELLYCTSHAMSAAFSSCYLSPWFASDQNIHK